MKLPCKHIFNKRKATNLSLYNEDVCDKRWTKNYYYKSQVIFKEPLKLCDAVSDVPIEVQTKTKNTRLLSANEKFRKASVKISKLAELLSISSQFNYERRMSQLEQIISIWSKKVEFIIKEIGSVSDNDDDDEGKIKSKIQK